MGAVIGDRAVVLGAGMAGLLAAGVLSEAYREVVVVDRDALPEGMAERRGAPQARHAHVLLAGGRDVLDEIFPGLSAQVVADGAPSGDVPGDVRMYLGGGRICPRPSGLRMVLASRPFLEGHVRARVRTLPGVGLLQRCDVVGLGATPDGSRITGVRLLHRADGSAEEELPADVVVDATGRASRASTWLALLGAPAPPEDRVEIDVSYATRRYRLDPSALDGDLAILNGPTPDNPRAGVLHLLEGGDVMVTLAGVLGDRPPLDPAGFAAFARSLRYADIYDAIRDAEPLDDPAPYRFPTSVWRHHERARGLPDGYVAIGDAICSLNPIYGQGMTTAALQARELRRHLRRHGRLRSRMLRRDLARPLAPAWRMAVGADATLPGVPIRPGVADRLIARYLARLQAAATTDPVLAHAFVRVSAMLDPASALLHPTNARRVLRPTSPANRRAGRPIPHEAGSTRNRAG